MALPRSVARFNARVTNRVTGTFAGRLPGFGIVTHVGRRSGRIYGMPVNVFRDGDAYVIALTYGAESDWVENVVAARGCELRTRGRTVRLKEPRIVRDPSRRLVPAPVGLILRLIRASDFMILSPDEFSRDRRSHTV
jgi:deazaflavin-dependent oxidoreductase (nitroreductase family)